VKLFFRKTGEGKPLIVIPGLLGASDNWMSTAKALAPKYAVYLLDMRNHGHSPHHPELTYPAMVQDVLEFMSDHEIPSTYLMGHSMGGKVAMALAMQYPMKVEKLVVVDIPPRPVVNPYFESIFKALQSLDTRSLQSRQEADSHLAKFIANPVIRSFLLKNLERVKEGGFRWRINLPVIVTYLPHIAEYVPIGEPYPGPALFIAGGESNYILPEDREEILKRFPRARIVTIPGAGHWVHFQAPQQFVEIVDSFLSE